jgi:hypothetical protein
MISMDKNLMTTVGVVACLLVTIYLFRELTKAKDDVEQLKNVSMHLMQMNEPPRPAPMPMPMPMQMHAAKETNEDESATANEAREEEVKEIAEEN